MNDSRPQPHRFDSSAAAEILQDPFRRDLGVVVRDRLTRIERAILVGSLGRRLTVH